jgi:hypothetical protein
MTARSESLWLLFAVMLLTGSSGTWLLPKPLIENFAGCADSAEESAQ